MISITFSQIPPLRNNIRNRRCGESNNRHHNTHNCSYCFTHTSLSLFSRLSLHTLALLAQKRRVACLTKSMSCVRHRQTPLKWKTRTALATDFVGELRSADIRGIHHVAQPSYSALRLEIGDFYSKRHTLLRTLHRLACAPYAISRSS